MSKWHSDETNYKTQIYEVSEWCQTPNFLLNVVKIKENIFEFKYYDITHEHHTINNDLVEICETFKYIIGLTIGNSLVIYY